MSNQDSRSSVETPPRKEGTPLSRAMRPINHVVERLIPSALVFSILLTFIVVVLALILTDTQPADLVVYWGDGLAGLLEFITQMALILLLGHILANTGPVQRGLGFLGSVPRSELSAYVFVFLVAAIASLITWGLGLVVGGLLAREVAFQGRQRGLRLHFPMLVASGFAGFVVWHMGYSASGPLTAATEDSFLAESLGDETIPIGQTVFSSWNMLAALATILLVGLALFLVAPRKGDKISELEIDIRETVDAGQEDVVTPADRLDRKSTRLNSSHVAISYAVFCSKKKRKERATWRRGATKLWSPRWAVCCSRFPRSAPAPLSETGQINWWTMTPTWRSMSCEPVNA